MSVVHRHGVGVDICRNDRSFFSKRRAGDFNDFLLFEVRRDSVVVVVQRHSIFSPQWKKNICKRPEESVRGLLGWNDSVAIEEMLLVEG